MSNKDTSLKMGSEHILKVLSLVTAAFLWFYVVNSEPIIVEKRYLIKARGSIGFDVDKVSSVKVDVTLKGARAFLENFMTETPKLLIDLSLKKYRGKKKITYTIKDQDFNLPFGINVVKINPQVIEFGLDKTIRKLVSIRANVINNLPKDLKLHSLNVVPQKIMIEGPRSIMREIGVIKTRLININKLSGQGEIMAFLEDEPRFIRYLDDSKHQLIYDIRPKQANMTLKNIEIKFISTNQKFRPSQRKVAIDILVPDNRTLRKSDVKVYADIPDIKKRKVKVKLRAVLPEGVHMLKMHPTYITIRK